MPHDKLQLKAAWLYQLSKLADLKNLQQTARQLGVSIQTLKRNLASCEQLLGLKVFIQQEQSCLLTPQGWFFLQEAQELLLQLENLEALFLDDQPTQRFTIGYTDDLTRSWLSQWVHALQQEAGSVQIRLLQGSFASLKQALHERKLQVMVAAQPSQGAPFQSRLCLTPDYVMVCGSQNPAQNWESLDLIECQGFCPAPQQPPKPPAVTTDLSYYALLLCQQSPYALYSPLMLAQPWLSSGQLKMLSPPCAEPRHCIYLSWHQQSVSHPLIRALLARCPQAAP